MNFIIEILKYFTEEFLLDKISPLFFVNQFQKGVLMRNGSYLRDLEPGRWNFKRPITDRFFVCNAMLDTYYLSNVNITTLDGVTCSISSCLEVVVNDPYKYLLEANDAPSNIRDIGMGVLAGELIDLNWPDINRRKTINAIQRNLNKDLENYGVEVYRIWFTDIVKTRAITLINQ